MSSEERQHNRASVLRLGLASAEDIRQLAVAEVAVGETVRPGTNRPVPRGLFCEQIFGREQDWECHCGKLRGASLAGRRCANCGKRVVHLRGTRFGYLELLTPVVHPLFIRPLARILDYSQSAFQRILAFMDLVVVDAGETPLRVGQLLTDEERRRCRNEFGTDFQVAMGGEAIRLLLDRVNLLNLGRQLREQLAAPETQASESRRQRRRLLRRLQVVDTICRAAPDDPDGWAKRMLLDCLPILPPGQRPLPQPRSQPWENINHVYARLLEFQRRLGRLFDLNAPDVIIHNDQRMVQLLVTAVLNHRPHVRPRDLDDDDQEPPPEAWLYRERHSSLAARLRCDIRHRLLNKRVDYSARAVLVPDPSLRLEECGLPWCIAIELFRPLVLAWLAEHGEDATACRAGQLLDLLKPHVQAEKDQAFVAGMRLYRELLQERGSEVVEALRSVMRGRWILLSRGRPGSPAYLPALQPRLIDGAAVSVHPLLGQVLRADFSGEVIRLHLPLSDQAQAEASRLLNPALAGFRSVSGESHLSLSDEACIGIHYLTMDSASDQPAHVFPSEWEVLAAWRADNGPLNRRRLDALLTRQRERDGAVGYLQLLVELETLGRSVFARSGLSLGIGDFPDVPEKEAAVQGARRQVDRAWRHWHDGHFCNSERFAQVIRVWEVARTEVTQKLAEQLEHQSSGLLGMTLSAGRVDFENLRRLAGLYGLVPGQRDEMTEQPITGNWREGLGAGEYFLVAQASRRRLLHEKHRRQEADDLRRLLVAVGQGVLVTMSDCGTTAGVDIGAPSAERSLEQALVGRVSTTDIVHPVTREYLARRNEPISAAAARALNWLAVPFAVRSPLTCSARAGVCQRCYGIDHATGRLVEQGAPVGLLAALAVAESAERLPPREFHLGHSVSASSNRLLVSLLAAGGTHYHSSLSRLRELLEGTTPQHCVPLARCSGVVQALQRTRQGARIAITPTDAHGRHNGLLQVDIVPSGCSVRVKQGERVERGEPLGIGPLAPREVLRLCGIAIAKQYLLHELRCVCRVQKIDIDDRHLELIVSRMFRRVTLKDAGDTDMVPGRIMERAEFRQVNEQLRGVVIIEESGDSRLPVGHRLDRASFERECARLAVAELRLPLCHDARRARARPRLQGISEISKSEDLLSALRVHEPVEVLANRALAGRSDDLPARQVISSSG